MPWRRLRWERHLHDLAVIAFGLMVVHGRTQILELAPGAGSGYHASRLAGDVGPGAFPGHRTPVRHVVPAGATVDVVEGFRTPPLKELDEALGSFLGALLVVNLVPDIDRNNVSDQDLRDVLALLSGRLVLVAYVLRERLLSCRALFKAAASAALLSAVDDDPDRTFP